MNPYGVKQPQGYPGLPDHWQTEWETLLAADGKTKLFAFSHRKKAPAVIQKVLIISHGFGEHGGRYLHFPHFLDSAVDAIYVHDHRGHGRSEGMRGDAPTFDTLVDDLKCVIQHVSAKYFAVNPRAEIHLLGHSLGGHIGLRLGFLHPNLPLKTFQISAPYLALYKEPSIVLRASARILAHTWGSLSLTAAVDPAVISRDERVVENYGMDRLNHSRMTPRFYASMMQAQTDTRRRTNGLHYPLALHVPLGDRLVDTETTLKFFGALENEGKRLFEYPDFRHEPMNDVGKEKFFDNMKIIIQK